MGIISALLLLSAAISSVVADPSGVVACTETGFSPTFTMTHQADTHWQVVIGTSGIAGCDSNEIGPIQSSGSTLTIDATTINAGELPYKSCSGTLANEPSGSPTQIDFSVSALITVRVQGTKISRETYFSVAITCSLTKLQATPTSSALWAVNHNAAVVTPAAAASNTFVFGVQIDYYTDVGRLTVQPGTWTGPAMGDWLFIQIKETTPSNTLFHFVVQECWFNMAALATKDGTEDIFYSAGCMVDTATANNDQQSADKVKTDTTYDMKVKAFFFTGSRSTSVYLHCQLYICMEDDVDSETVKCAQVSRGTCGMVRKRRSIEGEDRKRRSTTQEHVGANVDFLENGHGPVETRVITAEKALLLPNSEVVVPSCGAHFIYDRVSKGCSNRNLLDIKGVYLDIPWKPEYADPSSQTWKDFKIGKEYQLWALVMMFDTGRQIRGLEVLSATKGSVILTLRITYDETATATSAQRVFEEAYQRAGETRVDHILNIRQNKVVEYVRVGGASSGVNIESLTLIIIVVVLCAVVFVSVVAAWKVRSSRRAPSGDAKSHDNPTYNMS